MTQSVNTHSQNTYEIRIHGQLDESWLDWFGADIIQQESEPGPCATTTLTGIRMDQAGLVGLIRRLHGVGVILESVRRVPPSERGDGIR